MDTNNQTCQNVPDLFNQLVGLLNPSDVPVISDDSGVFAIRPTWWSSVLYTLYRVSYSKISKIVLLLFYKSLNGLGPEYLHGMLIECYPRTLRSAGPNQINGAKS